MPKKKKSTGISIDDIKQDPSYPDTLEPGQILKLEPEDKAELEELHHDYAAVHKMILDLVLTRGRLQNKFWLKFYEMFPQYKNHHFQFLYTESNGLSLKYLRPFSDDELGE